MIESYAREVLKKSRRLHKDIYAIEIMERFGWSWEQYENTPERIIRLIIEKDALDSKAQSHKSRKNG